jgi:chromosomal replication initiator protein
VEPQLNPPDPGDDFRAALKASVTPVTWQTWLQPLRTHHAADTLTVEAPSEFHRRWVQDRHIEAIRSAASDAFGADTVVEIGVDPAEPMNGSAVGLASASPAPPTPTSDTPLTPQRRPVQDFESRLISKYTFENFVVGQSNRFAHAAAMAVGEKPSINYNPLFIHGGAGLGKTHLLHAVGHHRRELAPGSVVRYVSSEQFFNEFINGIRRKQMAEFKARYRTIDVLLLDDVQFFEGKEQILEEFFHTFNSLYEAGKQLVISSDRHPKHLATLEDRLRSRFEWGLLTDIQPPDVETRLAILRKNAEFAPRPVPREVLEFIAVNVQSNIRELEGALTRVTAYAALTHERITLDMAREVLSDLMPSSTGRQPTPETIMDRVAVFYGISRDDLVSPSRKQPLARYRQIAMYLCRDLTDLSLPKIGAAFGGRDHSTVLHAVDKVKTLMRSDKQVFDQVSGLCQDLRTTRARD